MEFQNARTLDTAIYIYIYIYIYIDIICYNPSDILAQIRLPLRSIVKFSQADKELTYEITRFKSL